MRSIYLLFIAFLGVTAPRVALDCKSGMGSPTPDALPIEIGEPTSYSQAAGRPVRVEGYLSGFGSHGPILCTSLTALESPTAESCLAVHFDWPALGQWQEPALRILGRMASTWVTVEGYAPLNRDFSPGYIGWTLPQLTNTWMIRDFSNPRPELCLREQQRLAAQQRFKNCLQKHTLRSTREEACLDPAAPVVWLKQRDGSVRGTWVELPSSVTYYELVNFAALSAQTFVFQLADALVAWDGRESHEIAADILGFLPYADDAIVYGRAVGPLATVIECPVRVLDSELQQRCDARAWPGFFCGEAVGTLPDGRLACVDRSGQSVWIEQSTQEVFQRHPVSTQSSEIQNDLQFTAMVALSQREFFLAGRTGMYYWDQAKLVTIDHRAVTNVVVKARTAYYRLENGKVRSIGRDLSSAPVLKPWSEVIE